MKDYIKYVPVGLLSLFALKVLILGTALPELGVIAVLAGLAVFLEKSHEEAFKKDVFEKLEVHRKGFENVDSYIKKLFENDKEMVSQIQKIQLPQNVKSGAFSRM